MYGHPGKFEGELRISEFIWDLTLEGFEDEELGDVESFGYFAKVSLGPKMLDDVARMARETGVELTPGERQFVKEQAGVILSEDNFGFVSATYFDSKERLDEVWKRLEEDYGTWEDSMEFPNGLRW